MRKLITGIVLGVIALGTTACTPAEFEEELSRILDGDTPGVSSDAPTVNQDGDYYTVIGTAKVEHSPKQGQVEYCPEDELQRPQCSYGSLTFETRADAKKRGRQPINNDPVGWPSANEKVVIPALSDVAESRDYRGYFYNRSHLLADSLGGSAEPINMVPGTRTQNVGSVKNSGGMAYTEKIARDYLDSAQAKQCPLYYSASPQYEGREMLPRTVIVDIQSCDKKIDERVEVQNTANGFTIDYTTGTYVKN